MNHNLTAAMVISTQPNHSTSNVGYRFHPTDDELINHFLKPKMLGHAGDEPPISEIKVCDFEPWDLSALVNPSSNDQAWYFFCTRDYKYPRSARSNRTTRAGYWKPTGKARKVMAKSTKEEIGTKRSLVFYIKDHPKPKRTKWTMHEYECIKNSTLAAQGNFLLCKLKSKPDDYTNKGRFSPSSCDLVVESQDSTEIVAVSSPDEYEQSIHLDFGFENHNLFEMTAMSTYDLNEQDCLVEAGTDSAGESHYYLDPEIGTQNPNKSVITPMDFGFQNPDEKMDISKASEEHDQTPTATTPYKNTDMSTSSIAAGLQNIAIR